MHNTGKELALVQAGAELGIDDFAVVIRREIQEAQKATANALAHALKAGDALLAVKSKIIDRGLKWEKWLSERFIPPSTARLYMQLARDRARVEAEVERDPNIGVRAARRLIRKGRGGSAGEATPAKPETLAEHWRRLRQPSKDTEFTELLAEAGFLEMLRLMPAESTRGMQDLFERQLARLPTSKRKKLGKPYKHTLELTANPAREERTQRFRH